MYVIDSTLTGSQYPQFIEPQPGTTLKSLYDVVLPIHFASIVPKLEELLELPRGWNSYNADQIHPDAVATAINVLCKLGFLKSLPDVIPMSSGEVQLQWGDDNEAVEIECHIDGTLSILIEYDDKMEEWSVDQSDKLELLAAFQLVDNIR